MARALVRASTQYLSVASQWTSGAPLTLSAWVHVAANADQYFFGLDSGLSGASVEILGVYANSSGNFGAYAQRAGPGQFTSVVTTAAATLSTWFHVALSIPTINGDWKYYVSGADVTPAITYGMTGWPTISRSMVGNCSYAGVNYPWGGRICHAAIHSASLGAAEVAALAAGFCPLLVRPSALIAYYPLGGFHGDYDRDLVGGYNLTPTGSPTFVDQPRIIYPVGPHGVQLSSGGGGGGGGTMGGAAGWRGVGVNLGIGWKGRR